MDVVGTADAVRSGSPPAGSPSPSGARLLERYRKFCYRALGARWEHEGGSYGLAERLKQAGVSASPAMHRATVVMTTVIGVAATAAAALLLFALLLPVPDWYEWVGLIVAIAALTSPGAFGFLIRSRISNRKSQLNRELPFTLSELSVLASTGSSPIALMRRMSRRDHDPSMTGEFRRVMYLTDVEGKDLITALSETAKESASLTVRETFWDLANLIHQGGNLDEYLRNKSDAVFSMKRLVQKEFIERLTTFLDMYVSLVLIGVLMIAVGAFLLNAFGSTAAGFDANELLLLLTFGLVPLAVAMTTILISVAWARAE